MMKIKKKYDFNYLPRTIINISTHTRTGMFFSLSNSCENHDTALLKVEYHYLLIKTIV